MTQGSEGNTVPPGTLSAKGFGLCCRVPKLDRTKAEGQRQARESQKCWLTATGGHKPHRPHPAGWSPGRVAGRGRRPERQSGQCRFLFRPRGLNPRTSKGRRRPVFQRRQVEGGSVQASSHDYAIRILKIVDVHLH